MVLTIGFALILLITVSAKEAPKLNSCDEPGVITNGKNSVFNICSKDPDGRLSLKTLSCGNNSYFSEEKNKCVSKDRETDDQPSQKAASLSNEIGVKKQKQQKSGSESQSLSIAKKYYSLSNWCPKTKGRFCNTCGSIGTCINNKLIELSGCGINKYCDGYTNQCTNKTILECGKNYSFICTDMGLFPDPHFCNRYHLCLHADASPITFVCQFGQHYDPVNENCIYSSDRYHFDTPCPIFPECTEDFQVGVLTNNEKIYYVCLADSDGNLRRLLFKCPRNQIFQNNICQ